MGGWVGEGDGGLISLVGKLRWGRVGWRCGLGGWVGGDWEGGWGVLENFEIHVYT